MRGELLLINFSLHTAPLLSLCSFCCLQDGDETRSAPTGILFSLTTCPNYTAEVYAWIGFTIMTNALPSLIFTLFGLFQMTEWAIKKHKQYIVSTNGEYKKFGRKAILPFII